MDEKISKGEKSRQQLIEKSAALFLKNGYYHTGVAQILKECNLSKGSFYFYFKTKDDLGLAVADYFGERICDWLTNCLADADSFSEFTDHVCDDILSGIAQENYYGCPFSCFATETAYQNEDIAASCQSSVEKIIRIFAQAIRLDGISGETAAVHAATLLAVYEGYLVYYRITKNPEIIKRMKVSMLEIISAAS